MPYVWYIVCKRPIPQEARIMPRPGVVRVNLQTGKSSLIQPYGGGFTLLPLKKGPDWKPFDYWRDCHNSWEEKRLATAYRTKGDAESDLLVLTATKPHLIGHVRLRRERETKEFVKGFEE